MTVTLPRAEFRTLLEQAGAHEGTLSGRALRTGDYFRPSDTMGTFLCLGYSVEPHYALFALAEYSKELQRVVSAKGDVPPTVENIIGGFRLAINSSKFPEIPVAPMLDYLYSELRNYDPGLI